MVKQALNLPASSATLRHLGSRSAGLGMMIGGLGGAAAEGIYKGRQAYNEAKEQGATSGTAGLIGAASGLGGALSGKGLLTGSALGAGVGALHSANTAHLGNSLGHMQGFLGNKVEGLTRFGQRQIHGFTGAAPEITAIQKATEAARMGVSPDKVTNLQAIGLGSAPALAQRQHVFSQIVSGAMPAAKAEQALSAADAAVNVAHRAEQAGLTSLPGYAKGLMSNPGQTMRTALAEGWQNMKPGSDPMAKALAGGALALGAGGIAMDSMISQEQDPLHRSRAERIGRGVGSMVSPLIGAGLPMYAGAVLGTVPLKAGGAIGAGVNKVMGAVRPATGPTAQPPTQYPPQPGPTQPYSPPAALQEITMTMFGMGVGPTPANSMYAMTPGRMMGGQTGLMAYPHPFFDMAQQFYPPTIKMLFRWCRYYTLTNPVINAVVFKRAQYPITDLEVSCDDEAARKRWTEFLQDGLRIRNFQMSVGLDWNCLGGNTRVLTDAGMVPIRELAGKVVRVLSRGGVWRNAAFRSYGQQELWEVHTADGVLFATAGHRWPVRSSTGKLVWVTTDKLKNRSIYRTTAPRPPQDEEFYTGLRHGIVFGDGSTTNEGKQSYVTFYTKEKRELARYFEGHGTITPHYADEYLGVYGQPPEWKQLPDASASPSYWYGFVCGLLSTDGSVDVRGQALLSQKSRDVLLAVAAQLPRLGIVGGKVRGHWYWSDLTNAMEKMHYLSLKTQSLLPQDMMRSDQRKRFCDHYKKTAYGTCVGVSKVVPTGRVEEVYCCEEPETHSFVIENSILTGNCYGNSLAAISYPFRKYLRCTRCKFQDTAERLRPRYRFYSMEFHLNCPKCGHNGAAEQEDVYLRSENEIRLIRWNPEYVDIRFNDLTERRNYFYNLPGHVKTDLSIGKKEVVEQMPTVYFQAVKEKATVVLNPTELYHMHRPTLSDQDRGWGIPPLLCVLKHAFYLQIMQKAQESLLLESIVPLRILFPQAGSGSSDPYTNTSLVDWREAIATELAHWRRDPNYVPIFPLPIGSQTLGGDGKALLLTNEIQAMTEIIVNGLGVPREMVFGALGFAGTQVSLRMVENEFLGYIQDQLSLLRYIVKKIALYMNWPVPQLRLKPFKMADDLQRKAYNLQLEQMGLLSGTTLLADSDFDFRAEQLLRQEESALRTATLRKKQLAEADIQGEAQLIMAKKQAAAQQAMMSAQQAPAPGEPGGPEMGTQGSAPGSPEMGAGALPQALQAGQPAPAGAPPGAPPGGGGGQGAASVPGSAQSPLSPEQELGQGNMGVALPQLAQTIAQQLLPLSPAMQESALAQLAQEQPELAAMVQQMLSQLQSGSNSTGSAGPTSPAGLDMRPLPEQRAPRRQTPSI